MDPLPYFSDDYQGARYLFRRTCEQEGVRYETLVHPATGPAGLELTTEVAYVGPSSATQLLVLVSGVHGVEALSGSACQSGWLAHGGQRSLPADTAVLLIHAINCWGAAWGRRNTEGNIDLCRNFLDFSKPLPTRPIYEEIHATVGCPEYTGPARDQADLQLREFHRTRGQRAFMEALMGGQYAHPDGFEFGGTAPVWSNTTLSAILARHSVNARQVCIVEYHTGLGPYAYGTAVTMHTGAALERARRWFGDWVLAVNERSTVSPEDFYQVHGHTTEGYCRALPDKEVTAIVLEYGTYPPQQSLPLLLRDHWLEVHGDRSSALGEEIRAQLLAAHHPADPEWRRAIWDRSEQVLRQAFAGLHS